MPLLWWRNFNTPWGLSFCAWEKWNVKQTLQSREGFMSMLCATGSFSKKKQKNMDQEGQRERKQRNTSTRPSTGRRSQLFQRFLC